MLDASQLEPALIGTLMLRDDAVFELPGNFVSAALPNRWARSTFEAIQRLAKAGKGLSLPVVAAEARLTQPEVEWLKAAVRDGQLTSAAPIADKLLTRHMRERAIEVMREAAVALKAGEREPTDVLGELTAKLAGLSGEAEDWVSYREVALRALEGLEKGKLGEKVATGFRTLDTIAPIRKGNLVVLAAQSGVGKSTVALNIADNIARRGAHVLVHSFEMDESEIWARLAARQSGVPVDDILAEKPSDNAKQRVTADTLRRIEAGFGLHLNCGKYSLPAILHITEKAHRKHGLALAIVDYLGLTEVDLGKGANDEARLATVTRSLKQLAQRLQLPVVLVAQLNREVDRRQGEAKKGKSEAEQPLATPKLSDLRGSGRIGQDANLVLLLHNPWAQSNDRVKRQNGPYQLIVEKARMGRRSVLELMGRLEVAEFVERKTTDPVWGDPDAY